MKRWIHTKRNERKQRKISATTFGCTKVKWCVSWSLLVWIECSRQGDSCTLTFTRLALLGKRGMHLERGRMQQRAEKIKYKGFTRFDINAFTPAASPTSRGHISQNNRRNQMILGWLERSRFTFSRECSFAAFGPAVQNLWPKAVSYTHLTLPTKRIV